MGAPPPKAATDYDVVVIGSGVGILIHKPAGLVPVTKSPIRGCIPAEIVGSA